MDKVFDLLIDVVGDLWDRFRVGDFAIFRRFGGSEKDFLINLLLSLAGDIEFIINNLVCLL
jgi:hypothetical protein